MSALSANQSLDLAVLDAMFATSPVGLSVWDTDLRFVRVNATLAAINALPVDEHPGKALADVASPALAEQIAGIMRRVIANREVERDLVVSGFLNHDPATERTWHLTFFPVQARDGEILGVAAIVDEVTERRRAEAHAERLRESERQAFRRDHFMAEATALLASSLDYEQTLRRVAEVAVPVLFDWCAVDVVGGDGVLHRVAIAHADPEKVRLAQEVHRRFPDTHRDREDGAHEVVRTGQPQVFWDVPAHLLQARAGDDEHLRLILELGLRAGVIAPLTVRGRRLGAITFALAAESSRALTDEDVSLATRLGRSAALAIENSRLYTARSHIARTLQSSLLPRGLPRVPGVDVAVRYRAAGDQNEVGGDFYDVVELDDDRHLVVVGDVCGKGASAAAITALVRHTIRAGVQMSLDAKGLLRLLNRALLGHGAHAEEFQATFATLVLVVVEPTADGPAHLRVLSAGHPPPMRLRRDGAVDVLDVHGTVAGVTQDAEWQELRMRLETGETLLLYTDGALESRPRANALGIEGLRALVERMAGSDAATIVGSVESTVVSRQDGAPSDDIALVALQIPPA